MYYYEYSTRLEGHMWDERMRRRRVLSFKQSWFSNELWYLPLCPENNVYA